MSKALQAVLNIKADKDGLYSLNDIYQQAVDRGLADGKQSPYEWQRREGKNIIDYAKSVNAANCRIIKAARGKGGGTRAIPEICLAYSKYLSPALHMEVNQTFLRAKAGDVTLADEIVDRATPEELRKIKNLPAKANVREYMTVEELIQTAHAEMIAVRNMDATKARGTNECAAVCEAAARKVAAI